MAMLYRVAGELRSQGTSGSNALKSCQIRLTAKRTVGHARRRLHVAHIVHTTPFKLLNLKMNQSNPSWAHKIISPPRWLRCWAFKNPRKEADSRRVDVFTPITDIFMQRSIRYASPSTDQRATRSHCQNRTFVCSVANAWSEPILPDAARWMNGGFCVFAMLEPRFA